ncbi:MAG: sulfotransferase [Nevskia sp.]|nr:sulfotransferase [Nevskia sp.]
MNKPVNDHRQLWQPPQRPEWVQRINEEGYGMNISGVVPLDEKSLLETAIRSTGLSDFGADDWRESFRVLIKALEDEAELTLMGRLMTRSEILMLLEGRLRIEDAYKRHPEIEDEQIVQPIIIVGQGRSGTSLIQNALAHNPDNGALMHWEAMFPCPPPEKAAYRSDLRIDRADMLVNQWTRVTPTLASMHELSGRLPHEDMAIMAFNFMSPSFFDVMGQVGSYDAMVYGPKWDWEPAFRYHKRVLKLLQWKNPRKNWVLKDPLHLDRMSTILRVYPDACFVWPHRDPVRSLASLVSIVGTLQWGRSDHPFKGGSLEYMTDPFLSAARFNGVIDQIEKGVIPQKQMHHLFYKDLVADTVGSLEAMYRHFGIPLSEQGRRGIVQYMVDHPRDSRPPHRFNAGSPEAVARAREAFKRYQTYFDVPVE